MSEYENTILWGKFYKKANDQQRNMVRNLVEKASQRLDRIIETFPTYTLHNRTHALNVFELMGNLLESEIEKITALEGAILILSANLHDMARILFSKALKRLRKS